MKKNGVKVFVGMSGGVDSSVTAKLLVDQGYDVTGVFIKVWQPDFFECTWKEDRRDAMRVAAQLGIPFITIDAENEYEENVVNYMVDEYKAGRTPNPDVMCNNSIKFGVFYEKAMSMGADYIATGHYARVSHEDELSQLLRAVDDHKDQTYFLWNISREALSKTLFPVGEHRKDTIREIARDADLFTAEKKDSQGLCFIGKIPIKDFLSHYINSVDGDVLNKDGEVIGKHDGSEMYTIGQRHGFTISKKTPDEFPYYVIEKDIEKNTISVSNDQSVTGKISTIKVILKSINQISEFVFEKEINAKIRHGQKDQKVILEKTGQDILAIFSEPQKGLATGQSCVLYSENICLGGGIINTVNE
jgi:tRNA-uridine 2-sulfurtransferase